MKKFIMKNIWLILFLILTCEVAFCQTIVPRANSSITVQDSRGTWQYNAFLPKYADTTAANVQKGIDSLGAVIYVYATHSLWVRSGSPKTWVELGGGGGAGTVTSVGITGSDFSISGSPVTTSGNISLTLATVNGNVGSFGSATQAGTFTVNGKGLITAASNTTITPAVGSITGLGTGVATALGVNIGTAGSFVVNGGALGTPSSGTLTNASGLPIVGGTTGTLTIARGGTNLTTLGTDGQLLRVNTGATALEYFTPTYATDNIYTADGTLTGDRVVDLNGNDLTIANASNIEILLASSTNELIFTGDTIRNHGQVVIGNIGDSYALYFVGQTSGAIGIQPAAEAGTYTLTLPTTDGDADQFLQTNGSGVLTWATGGGGATIYTGDGTIDDATRTVTISAGNALIWDGGAGSSITSTADSHNFNINGVFKATFGGNDFLSIDPTAGAEVSTFQAYNVTDDDNFARFQGVTANDGAEAIVLADFNNGVKQAKIDAVAIASSSSITSTADLHTITGAVSIVGVTTLTGNLLAIADNTYDIGDATNSFQDIFSRTLVLDGSTSGTVTLASDAVAKSFRATTLTGEGYVSTNSISIQQSAESLADDNSIQPVFSSGQDVFTVQGSTLYEIEGYYDVSSGATSHSTLIAFVLAGGASINWIKYNSAAYQAAIDVTTNAGRWVSIDQVAATAINAAGVQTRWFIYYKGFVSINAAGTVTPSIQFSTGTSGTCEIGIGSYFKLTPVGVNSTAAVGPVN